VEDAEGYITRSFVTCTLH